MSDNINNPSEKRLVHVISGCFKIRNLSEELNQLCQGGKTDPKMLELSVQLLGEALQLYGYLAADRNINP